MHGVVAVARRLLDRRPPPHYVDVVSAYLDFLPLGGTGEIGMNLNLYGFGDRWLMVDAGVMFERIPGGRSRVLYPDPSFIAARRRRLVGLVLTHVHQDHLGAVADLWPKLRCTVYATPFAAAMLEGPLRDARLLDQVPVRVVEESGAFEVGPFQVRRIPLTHSTVEMGALHIETPAGRVLHTGDFKIDADPVVGRRCDEASLKRLHGFDLCVSDSTNADHEGWTASEASVEPGLREQLASARGRVAVPLFSTNVARIETLAKLALELDRDLVFVGRSVERTVMAAKTSGYLDDLPAVVPMGHFGYLPPERVLMVCTGSQGEPEAALGRMAAGEHRWAYLEPGDKVVFSARAIPGNELSLQRLHLLLRRAGVEVVTAEDAPVHVSGHPRREELRQLYTWARPKAVVPVHGTPSKLEAHAELAEGMGIPAVRLRNGQRLRLTGGELSVVETVRTGRLERQERSRDDDRRHRGRRWR